MAYRIGQRIRHRFGHGLGKIVGFTTSKIVPYDVQFDSGFRCVYAYTDLEKL